MANIIMETERAILTCMSLEDAEVISSSYNLNKNDAMKWIESNVVSQKEKGFSVYSVFLKQTGRYIGYCGCVEIELKDNPEIKLLWDISKVYKEDDIDVEVAFKVRNFMFRYFDFRSLVALISKDDPLGMNIAEEIDMNNEYTIQNDGQAWLVYIVFRSSKKFLASYGDGESDSVRTAIQNRRAALNPAARFKSPKLRPN